MPDTILLDESSVNDVISHIIREVLMQVTPTVRVQFFVPWARGILRISSDGDDRRIFFWFESSDSGIFWGRKIWQVFFCVA